MRRLPRPTGRTIAIFGIAILASIAFAIVAREIRVPAVDDLDIRIEMAVHRTLDSTIGDVWAYTASFVGSNVFLIPALALLSRGCACDGAGLRGRGRARDRCGGRGCSATSLAQARVRSASAGIRNTFEPTNDAV